MPGQSKTIAKKHAKKTQKKVTTELRDLKHRLEVAEETLSAIRAGHVDALVVGDAADGEQVFTLAGAENSYRIFVEAMTEGAVTIGHDGTVLYCNRGFADLLGSKLERVIGSAITHYIPVEDRRTFAAIFGQSLHGAARAELSLRSTTGRLVPVFMSMKSFKEHGVKAICVVVTDLTEQKKHEQVMAAGRLAQEIIQQSAEAIAVCDADGNVILASQALHEMCGSNPLFRNFDEVMNLCFGENPTPMDGNFSVKEVLAGSTLYRGMEVVVTRGGERRHLLLNAGRIRLSGSPKHGCVITLFDIEERKQAQEALRRSEKLAATGRLAATIAHEINNPLESVTNLLYLSSTHPETDPTVKHYLDIAQNELSRVAHITKQTLAFHREGQLAQPVNIVEVLNSVLYMVKSKLREKTIELKTELEFDGNIQGFSGELRQVFMNLVLNAIEATPQGGFLRVRAYPGREWNNGQLAGVRVVIADNGSGISADSLERIFEAFYTTKGQKGSGLGLWVTHAIVAKHGGRIRVKSRTTEGKSGTVFSIFLPVTARKNPLTAAA